METAEATLPKINSLDAALRLVVQIECSEINRVFDAALAATDATFVKKLKPFREATEIHLSYLAERLPGQFARMIRNVRELRVRFPTMPN